MTRFEISGELISSRTESQDNALSLKREAPQSVNLLGFIEHSKKRLDSYGNRIDLDSRKTTENIRLRTKDGFAIFYTREKGGRGKNPQSLLLEQDPALQNYYEYLKQRGKNKGRLSTETTSNVRAALLHFFEFCSLPITDHTLTDLVHAKRQAPNADDIEQALRKYTNLAHSTVRTTEASLICGVFGKGNFCPIRIHLNTHPDRLKPLVEIPEPILKAIYRESPKELQVLQELQAELGERITAVSMLQAKDFNFNLDPDYAVVFFDGNYTKGHIIHFSICHKKTALEALAILAKKNRQFLYPNHASQWKKLTKYASKQYNVRYHSHYLRERFETIADDTGISMNKVNYLMGGAPHGHDDTARHGHLPDRYIIKEATKMIRFYDKYLARQLSLEPLDEVSSSIQIKKELTNNEILVEIERLKKLLPQE